MVFGVAGGSQLETGYEVQNSARFDNAGGSALGTTFGTATNDKKFTLSFWFKVASGTTSGGRTLFGGRSGYENIFIHEDTIRQDWNNASSGTVNWAPFVRDESAWYHFVIAQDTTQGTAANRAKFYINGEQAGIRTGVTLSYPGQNLASGYNVSGVDFYLSSYNGSAGEVNGYYSEVAFVDGQQLTPSSFAETSTDGIWVPKEFKDDVTFGNNGFYLEFKQTGTGTNSSGIGADTSGNDNHLSVTGLAAQDITTDTPTNNFCTMNPLTGGSRGTFAEGNLKVSLNMQGSVPYGQVEFGTFYVNKGKWYYEVKATTIGGGGQVVFGWNERHEQGGYYNGHNNLGSSGNVWYGDDGKFQDGSTSNTTSPATFSDGDIIGIACDFDNKKFYAHKNGTYQSNGTGTGDPANGTNGFSFTSHYNDFWTPWISKDSDNASHSPTAEFNFGNAPFSISSGNADDNGHGNFEYDVPSGFYALNSKNLAQFG
tara:strand:- start:14 stop:1462 length:1449 start_codon:yes stop_codon:yes gene_type:complete